MTEETRLTHPFSTVNLKKHMSKKAVAVILAAGKGTRMNHYLPKALVPIHGVPMVVRLLDSVEKAKLGTRPVIVVGYKKKIVMKKVGRRARFVDQKRMLGTGHAVMVTKKLLQREASRVIVIYGDNPFFSPATIRDLVRKQRQSKAVLALSTVVVPDFKGPRKLFAKYGHIVRDKTGKKLERCVEWKDATRRERSIREVNSGAYCFDATWLWTALTKLKTKNVSGEYYLTDLMEVGVREGKLVLPVPLKHWREGIGANTLEDIAAAERVGA